MNTSQSEMNTSLSEMNTSESEMNTDNEVGKSSNVDFGEQIRNVTNVDGIRTILECPVCVTITSGKIYQCENAHKICSRCYSQLPDQYHCPQGRCYIKKPPSRSRDVENLIEVYNLTLTCPNAGCKETLPVKEMREHEEECPKRPEALIKCYLDYEHGRMALESLEDHLIKDHAMEKHEGNRKEFAQPLQDEDLDGYPIVTGLTCGEHTFYYSISVSQLDSNRISLRALVMAHGDQNMADQYVATISVWKEGSPYKTEATQPIGSVTTYGGEHHTENMYRQSLSINRAPTDILSECDMTQKEAGFTHILQHSIEIKKKE